MGNEIILYDDSMRAGGVGFDEDRSKGLVPRQFNYYPVGSVGDGFNNSQLIPENEIIERIRIQEADQSSLEHLMRYNNVDSLDQDGLPYCFPAGTRIRMADGSQKNIENIRILDKVLSAEGNVRRVMQCHVREHLGQMTTVKLWGHSHVKMTPNHSVLTKRGYVAAENLTKEDWVKVPRFAPQTATIIQTAEHVQGVKRRIKNKVGVGAAWETKMPSSSEKGFLQMPDFIKLTPAAGRIFGLFLAEGYYRKNYGLVWSFGSHERDTLVKELVELLDSEWGIEAAVEETKNNVCLVHVTGVMWKQLFFSLFGKGAGAKKMHPDLMSGPKDFLEAVFWGWMDGDGCTKQHNKGKGYDHVSHCGATISHDMALNLFDIASFLGLMPTISYKVPKPVSWANKRPVWYVSVIPDHKTYRPNFRKQLNENEAWYRVREIVHDPYTGTVFNIGVEVDNSYVAEGLGVHNCWAYSTTTAVMVAHLVANNVHVPLSGHMVGCLVKGYRAQGGWNGESLAFACANGISPQTLWPQSSMSRSNDTPAMRAAAKEFMVTEWTDLDDSGSSVKIQLASLLLQNIPVMVDYNWWSHSVCAVRLMSWNPFRIRIRNSWGNSWSQQGYGDLEGSRAMPNGAACPRVLKVAA